MKRKIFNPNGIEVEFTAEEIAQAETHKLEVAEQDAKEEAEIQARKDLKASARSKLVAGEPLTNEEAATIVP
jgi:hypothetical protein